MKTVITSIVDNGEFYESQQYWAANIIYPVLPVMDGQDCLGSIAKPA